MTLFVPFFRFRDLYGILFPGDYYARNCKEEIRIEKIAVSSSW
jgi:hypothetical protein